MRPTPTKPKVANDISLSGGSEDPPLRKTYLTHLTHLTHVTYLTYLTHLTRAHYL